MNRMSNPPARDARDLFFEINQSTSDTISSVRFCPVPSPTGSPNAPPGTLAHLLAVTSWAGTVSLYRVTRNPEMNSPPGQPQFIVEPLSQASIQSSSSSSSANTSAPGGGMPSAFGGAVSSVGNPSSGTNSPSIPCPILGSCWMDTGTHVMLACADGRVRMMDLNTMQSTVLGAPQNEQFGHSAPVRQVCKVPPHAPNFFASASWDRSVCYWDVRASSNGPVSRVSFPERVYAMDTCSGLLAAATATPMSGPGSAVGSARDLPKNIFAVDLNAQDRVHSVLDNLLRYQLRCLAAFQNGRSVVVGSIEGRCCVSYVDKSLPTAKNFAFKCHRLPEQKKDMVVAQDVYPVNDVAVHPAGALATVGGDGVVNFWDPVQQLRLKHLPARPSAMTSANFSGDGLILACAECYDWSKGNDPNYTSRQAKVSLYRVQPNDIKSEK
eukprot:ANDGO_06748.mRNA.1 Nucleoporin GLE2